MNYKLKALAFVPLAVGALALTACSDDSSDNASATTATNEAAASTATPGGIDTTSCAPTPATVDGEPAWTVNGTQGSVAFTVTDDATNAAPRVQVTTPFQVDETQVQTLIPGDGAEVTAASTVTVCYEGVNGRDGKVFDSAYQRGESTAFPASGVVPGFKQALVGQKVGSTVGVVITSADGYPDGTGDGSILAGDTIVFALKILAAQ